ncbi:POC1 centriolar protein homolog A isoform X1 [Manduca sexta]|uniref:POC1 centriolar protein homolog A isoform X1 n=1 Tax=Manduca sexta TaxID=7130 RepID=UPI0018902ECB|nr:POC1 centriolar protein homolog A isoform X1 [Manduca sexta]
MDNKTSYPEPCLEKQLKGHRNGITALYFSPNEQQIASGSLDNSVLLWDLRGTMRSYRFQGHDEAVMDVTFSPSGKYMASASRDKTVRLWVPTVTGSTGMFKAHSQTVRSVQFSSDGTKILTASDDKIVKLWSTDKHKFISSYVGHTNWVRCARISNDGSVIASCSDDKTTRLWSLDSGECIHTYKDQRGHGTYLAWHPSGCYVAVATSQGNVKLYDIRTHNLVQYYSIHNDAVNQVAIHPSGSYILTGSKDGKMKILDLLEGHPIYTLSGHSGSVNAVSFSTSGDYFASAGEDKLVFIWKTNFTEQGNEKENVAQNMSMVPRSASQISKTSSALKGRNQGARLWYMCYHSMKYPAVTFVHMDDEPKSLHESVRQISFQEPNANSTFIDATVTHYTPRLVKSLPSNFAPDSTSRGAGNQTSGQSEELSSYDVGHMSHIPQTPPSPATYTIPSIINRSIGTEHDHQDDIFGMIKLKDNDVCYTSGTIEWVGRKRNFPINSGFKIISDNRYIAEPLLKKVKILNKSVNGDKDNMKECDCADVLPTVNAIVDHLNALHEAVDLVDLRLNALEDVAGKDGQLA